MLPEAGQSERARGKLRDCEVTQVVERQRKFYAWGFEDQAATAEEMAPVLDTWHRIFGIDRVEVLPAPTLETIEMRPARITARSGS